MTEAQKKHRKGLIVLTIIFALITGLLFLAYSSNTHLMKSRYEVVSSDLPAAFDGCKILQISDLHDKEFGDLNNRLIKLVEKEDPDIIVATGDLINSTDTPDDFTSTVDLMYVLTQDHDVYYVDGNHETAMDIINSEYYDEWIGMLNALGVHVLDNEKAVVELDGESIDIYGLWYNGRYYNDMSDAAVERYFLDVDHVEELIGASDPDRFNLLLTHNPVYFDVYSEWGANLTLAGHMHGGVIRIPFKGGLISPERVYWPEYDAGEFVSGASGDDSDSAGGDSIMIVNRGLGNGNSGYRFLNWPDVSIITLKAS